MTPYLLIFKNSLLAIILGCCTGDFGVEITLTSFANPSDYTLAGSHCDAFWWTGLDLCDIGLDICVVPTQKVGLNFNNCNGQNFSTGDVTTNVDSAEFVPGHQYGQWPNPNTIQFTGPFQGVHVKVTAIDYDTRTTDDIIDKIDVVINAGTVLGVSNLADIVHSRPAGSTELKFHYTVNCINGYSGSDCSIAPTTVFTVTPKVCHCGQSNYYGTEGTFSSPDYPQAYCNNMQCNYYINVPDHYYMTVQFDEISLGPGDYVLVYEGYSSGPLLFNQTGTPLTGPIVNVESSIAQVVLVTDGAGIGFGFTASYHGYASNQSPPTVSLLPTTSTSSIGTTTATGTQPTTTALICYNGGTPLGNMVCQCTQHYTGDGCETLLCQRGGTPVGNACSCPPRTSGTYCENALESDCGDLWTVNCVSASGVYAVQPNNSFNVECDMSNDGGGWTVMQRRVINDTSTNFNRTLAEYQQGFGNMSASTSYWLGLEKMFTMSYINGSGRPMALLIVLTDCQGNRYTEYYPQFQVLLSRDVNGTALPMSQQHYPLLVSEGTGSAGDAFNEIGAFSQAQNHHPFSTYDSDVDGLSQFNCAQQYQSGWWFGACGSSNLNGQYVPGCQQTLTGMDSFWGNGILWTTKYPNNYSFRTVVMKIRPSDFIPNNRYCQ